MSGMGGMSGIPGAGGLRILHVLAGQSLGQGRGVNPLGDEVLDAGVDRASRIQRMAHLVGEEAAHADPALRERSLALAMAQRVVAVAAARQPEHQGEGRRPPPCR